MVTTTIITARRALRDFELAYDRYASFSTELAEAAGPFMSAVPLKRP